MKKVFRIFLLFLTIFAIGGCSEATTSSNVINNNFKQVSTKEDIIFNFKQSIQGINGISFKTNIVFKEKEYEITGKVIIKESIEKSIININYKDNSLYIKDGNVYVNYVKDDTNFVIKDTLNNFVEETINFLESKGVNSNKEKIYDIIKNKNITDVNLDKLVNNLFVDDNEYTVDAENIFAKLNKAFLPEYIEYKSSNLEARVTFSYNDVTIKVPWGYDIMTLNLNDLKELLDVNCIGDLIK